MSTQMLLIKQELRLGFPYFVILHNKTICLSTYSIIKSHCHLCHYFCCCKICSKVQFYNYFLSLVFIIKPDSKVT